MVSHTAKKEITQQEKDAANKSQHITKYNHGIVHFGR
jgi:hypothetical protein